MTLPRDEEREFKFSELFFSTTDKKGVIHYGNDVFTRIAGYKLDELQGVPHNIIRHPDMPQSAFKLVWDYLKQDKVVAAYVKNMAKDGRYYWVMALIIPYKDGYLSIRLKPSSDFFPVIQNAYKAILEVENRVKEKGRPSKEVIAAGTNKLIELLNDLGFPSYNEFMWASLSAEMTLRESKQNNDSPKIDETKLSRLGVQKKVGPELQDQLLAIYRHCKKFDKLLSVLFSKLDTFSRFGNEITSKTDFILKLGEEIRLLSMNAEIQSAKLGDSGAALRVVASKLGHHSITGTNTISRLNQHLTKLAPIISNLVFNAIASKLKIEMASHFLVEILEKTNQVDIETSTSTNSTLNIHINLLIQSFLETARKMLAALNHLQRNLGAVDQETSKMRKFMHTLAVINLAGKIETARSDTAQAFTTIFEQVQAQTHEAESELSEFLQLICENTAQLTTLNELDERMFYEFETLLT